MVLSSNTSWFFGPFSGSLDSATGDTNKGDFQDTEKETSGTISETNSIIIVDFKRT